MSYFSQYGNRVMKVTKSICTRIKWPAYTIPRGVSFVCDFGLTSCGACTACAAITTVAPLLRYRRCRSGALRHAQDRQQW